jgi:hypothetical protein
VRVLLAGIARRRPAAGQTIRGNFAAFRMILSDILDERCAHPNTERRETKSGYSMETMVTYDKVLISGDSDKYKSYQNLRKSPGIAKIPID